MFEFSDYFDNKIVAVDYEKIADDIVDTAAVAEYYYDDEDDDDDENSDELFALGPDKVSQVYSTTRHKAAATLRCCQVSPGPSVINDRSLVEVVAVVAVHETDLFEMITDDNYEGAIEPLQRRGWCSRANCGYEVTCHGDIAACDLSVDHAHLQSIH